MERFANTSEGRRGRGIAFLDTWKHKRKPGSGPDSNIVPECKSWFTPSLALVLIPMQPRGRQPASRCQPSTIIPSWWNACVADSRGPIPLSRRSPLHPDISTSRDAYESRAGNFFLRLFSRREMWRISRISFFGRGRYPPFVRLAIFSLYNLVMTRNWWISSQDFCLCS